MSDNSATNLIIDKVGIRNVNARMDSLGLRHTRLHAKVFLGTATTIDTAATRIWGLGVTTPEEMGGLFEHIYRGTAVSPAASKQMLDILRKNFDYEEIPRLLPPGVAVAHKTGKLDASRSDCGIVFVEGKDYVLCIFTRDNKDRSWRVDTEARIAIGELARIVHDGMTAK